MPARAELQPVLKKHGRRAGAVATLVVSTVGLASCFAPGNENRGKPEETPSHSPSQRSQGDTIKLDPVIFCGEQAGTQEGQLPTGTPVLLATVDRPSVFVISPDRSTQQSFIVASVGNPGEFQTVTQGPTVGIVGEATGDLVFDTTGGRAVWAKTCEPTPYDAGEEVKSRANDLCNRSEMGITEVVIYSVGADGKPIQVGSKVC